MKAYSLLLLLVLSAFNTTALAEDQDVNTTAAYQCTNCTNWCQTSYPGDAAVLMPASEAAHRITPIAPRDHHQTMKCRMTTAVAQPRACRIGHCGFANRHQ
jgi:hypothetical protein